MMYTYVSNIFNGYIILQDYERKIEELQEMILKKQAEVCYTIGTTSKWFY